MAAEGVYGEVLPVQAHVGEKVELVPVVVQDQTILVVPLLGLAGQLLQASLAVHVPAEDYILAMDWDKLKNQRDHERENIGVMTHDQVMAQSYYS